MPYRGDVELVEPVFRQGGTQCALDWHFQSNADSFMMASMQGFQAKTVAAVRAQRVVCVVRRKELRAKAFQIGFDKDGSLFIHFPYFQHRTGILSSSEIPATGERHADVNLEQGG